MMKKPGTPERTITWLKGPRVDAPAAELVTWLGANRDKLTRVPLVLGRGEVGFSTRGARIGGVVVRVTDAALGIGIAMRARRSQAPSAAFIVEGYWRGADHYDIRRASTEPITDEELAAFTHLEVELAEPRSEGA